MALEEGADLAKELSGALGLQSSEKLRKEAHAKTSLAKSIRSTLEALPKVTAHTQHSPFNRKKKRRK